MTTRIDAPPRLLTVVSDLQQRIRLLEAQINAVIYGAAITLDVPEGWQWEETGWRAPADAPPPVDGADD